MERASKFHNFMSEELHSEKLLYSKFDIFIFEFLNFKLCQKYLFFV